MITPLPAASPSALSTVGKDACASCASASSRLRSSAYPAVGTPASAISSLAKAFDPSSSAAALVGPKAAMPASSKASTAPATRPASGPITARSMPLLFAAATIAAASSAATSRRHSASAAIPAFPGAQSTSATCGERRSAFTIACSRPPPPTTRTFKSAGLQRGGQILGGQRRQGLARHRPTRAELDGDLGHRLLVRSLDHGDEVVLPQRRVLGDHFDPHLFDLPVDLGDPARMVLQRPHTLRGQVREHQKRRHFRSSKVLMAVSSKLPAPPRFGGAPVQGIGAPPPELTSPPLRCGENLQRAFGAQKPDCISPNIPP